MVVELELAGTIRGFQPLYKSVRRVAQELDGYYGAKLLENSPLEQV